MAAEEFFARPVDGWISVLGSIGVYGNDYFTRATITLAGLGANPPEDAVYPLLVTDADGSLDIHISHTDPGPDRRANWLPAPATGPLGITMRLYAPHPEVLNGAWTPPPVRKVS
ncbi:DUF1214 domain-containing protein [Nocardia sp. AG03]|uniref:DUF1214 domain-containing protein n=1 Tax=Nocardia sp. AG03 TaxID=3025312 RepID=UPI0024186C06|nr:DUF1214 domain-containing protein [Nocardia sp. AG03]